MTPEEENLWQAKLFSGELHWNGHTNNFLSIKRVKDFMELLLKQREERIVEIINSIKLTKTVIGSGEPEVTENALLGIKNMLIKKIRQK